MKNPPKRTRLLKTLKFYLLKLPFVYAAIPLGFIFEFIITFPYIVMTGLDKRRRVKSRAKPGEDQASSCIRSKMQA